jgi:hypothetical protein
MQRETAVSVLMFALGLGIIIGSITAIPFVVANSFSPFVCGPDGTLNEDLGSMLHDRPARGANDEKHVTTSDAAYRRL